MGRNSFTARALAALSTARQLQTLGGRHDSAPMVGMKRVPQELLDRPFTRAEAIKLGVTSRMLQGERFVRLFPRVWRHVDHKMTEADHVSAARLALPAGAALTGISRIRQLGLGYGSVLPLHFVLQGELHLAFDNIALHRTVMTPPLAEEGQVTGAAAFLAYCRTARTIDAIKVGDWLLHEQHMTSDEVADLCAAQPWRDGAVEALSVLPHLDEAARSLKETETRALLVFAGLPRPEVNIVVERVVEAKLTADLGYPEHDTVIEYEGAQHQEDRDQFVGDIDRYAIYRRADVRYVQVTKEKLKRPRHMVRTVHAELVAGGYQGPEPDFGELWAALFRPIRSVVGRRVPRRAVG